MKNHQFALPPFALFIICSDLLYLFFIFFRRQRNPLARWSHYITNWWIFKLDLSLARASGRFELSPWQRFMSNHKTDTDGGRETAWENDPNTRLESSEEQQAENWCQSILLCRLLITQTYQNPHHKASSPNRLEKNPSLLINNEKNQPVTTKYIFNAQDVHTLEIARCARAFTWVAFQKV